MRALRTVLNCPKQLLAFLRRERLAALKARGGSSALIHTLPKLEFLLGSQELTPSNVLQVSAQGIIQIRGGLVGLTLISVSRARRALIRQSWVSLDSLEGLLVRFLAVCVENLVGGQIFVGWVKRDPGQNVARYRLHFRTSLS